MYEYVKKQEIKEIANESAITPIFIRESFFIKIQEKRQIPSITKI
jgi:hypothetical protein